MPIRQLQLQCPACNSITPHNQDVPNHVVHGLLTLFTAGLYLPIWIIVALGSPPPARCVKCGTTAQVVTAQASAAETARSHKALGLIIVGVGVLLGVYAALVALGVLE